jgi:hypothetical protein
MDVNNMSIEELLEMADKTIKGKKKRSAPRKKRRKKVTKSGNGYSYIWVGNKQVLKHRHLMEQKLKRKLMPHEAVYFLDGNKENFSLDNLKLGLKPGKHSNVECPHCHKNIFS